MRDHNTDLEEKYTALTTVLKQENKLLQDQILEMTEQNVSGHRELADQFKRRCEEWEGIIQSFGSSVESGKIRQPVNS